MMYDLSVVVVSWNVRDLLRRCLTSVLATQDCRVEAIVVDNASSDGSPAMVRSEFPQVRLIESPTNLGYPGGNNAGLAVAGGRYLMILNPDTQVLGEALSAMVAYADAHPEVGALGPQLRWPDGAVQSSRRRFPTLATALFESTWLEPYAPRAVLRRYRVEDRPDDEVQEVDWVTGAAVMVRRAAFEQVGGMDEGFFMYSEELDWCRRIRDAGWKVVFLPSAQIVHHEGKSSEQAVAARHVHFHTSKVRYFRKYHGAAVAEGLRLFLLGNYVWQTGVESLKWLLSYAIPSQRDKRAMRAQRVGVYRQVLRSGLRPAA